MQARSSLVVMLFLSLVCASADAAKKVDPDKKPVPQWLWTKQAQENQFVLFRYTFETPSWNGIPSKLVEYMPVSVNPPLSAIVPVIGPANPPRSTVPAMVAPCCDSAALSVSWSPGRMSAHTSTVNQSPVAEQERAMMNPLHVPW